MIMLMSRTPFIFILIRQLFSNRYFLLLSFFESLHMHAKRSNRGRYLSSSLTSLSVSLSRSPFFLVSLPFLSSVLSSHLSLLFSHPLVFSAKETLSLSVISLHVLQLSRFWLKKRSFFTRWWLDVLFLSPRSFTLLSIQIAAFNQRKDSLLLKNGGLQ